MRARTIVVILGVAMGLGLVAGWIVLPARSTLTVVPGAAPSTSGSSSPTLKPAGGPITARHMVAATEFGKAGFSKHVYVQDRVGDGRYANAACAGEKTLDETLGQQRAHFRGLMTTTDTDADDTTLARTSEDQVAREVAADAGSPSLAQNFAERLLLEEVPCQETPATHWVYGPTHTVVAAPSITASWMGLYNGDLNTTGTAPRGEEPCGGIAILRNGSHYGILEVDACLDTAQMTRIVSAALTQL